jgi:hypothetical protein
MAGQEDIRRLNQQTQRDIETRSFEDMTLHEYIPLLEKQISSATTAKDLEKVGIYDNTRISFHSDHPQELFENFIHDMQNPEIFNYEPISLEDYGNPPHDGLRQIFLWNSQRVQLLLRRIPGSAYSLRFVASDYGLPAGYSNEVYASIRDEKDTKFHALNLARTKEQAMVVKDMLGYCDKNDIRGTLHLYFGGTRRADLAF